MSFIKTFFTCLPLAVPVPTPSPPGADTSDLKGAGTNDPFTGHVPLANPETPWGAPAGYRNPALGKATPTAVGTVLLNAGELYPHQLSF